MCNKWPQNAWKRKYEGRDLMTHRWSIVCWLAVTSGVLKLMKSHIHCHLAIRAQITRRQKAQMIWKWHLGPLYRGWPKGWLYFSSIMGSFITHFIHFRDSKLVFTRDYLFSCESLLSWCEETVHPVSSCEEIRPSHEEIRPSHEKR